MQSTTYLKLIFDYSPFSVCARYKRTSRESKNSRECSGGKQYFGGETIGFLDIAVGWIGCWARMNEEAGVNMIDEEMIPLLSVWFQK